ESGWMRIRRTPGDGSGPGRVRAWAAAHDRSEPARGRSPRQPASLPRSLLRSGQRRLDPRPTPLDRLVDIALQLRGAVSGRMLAENPLARRLADRCCVFI